MYSSYIIDGTRMDYTPAQMLDDCMPADARGKDEDTVGYDSIVDEIADHTPRKTAYDSGKILDYLDKVLKIMDKTSLPATVFPKSYTKRKIASSLISTLWKKGHFALEDLGIRAYWKWDCAPLGNMAAFYFSAEAASQYLFDLGIRLDEYSFVKTQDTSDVSFSVMAESASQEQDNSEYDFFNEHEAREIRYCWLSDENKCSDRIAADPSSWLIYIPFDTCEYRLGNSMLEAAAGVSGDKAPEIQDPDYFMDCFEVVRELVEDGVIISGTGTGPGGLAAAAARLCAESGISIDISGIERSSGESDIIRILFSEIPGVLIQISDADYDYMDAQLLLQDIAYFPIGHPSQTPGFSVVHGKKSGVAEILASLVQGN